MDIGPEVPFVPAALPGLTAAEQAELDRLRSRLAELERRGAGRATITTAPPTGP